MDRVTRLRARAGRHNHVKQELMPDVDFSQFDQPHEREEATAEAPANGKGTELDTELKWD